MGSYYQCSDPDSNEKNWIGHIRPLNINRNEFEVTARGSTFHLLVGKHAYGKYLCIPNWGIGTEISSLSDCFWNEYSCAVTPQVRQTGNRLSGLAGTAYASLLT